MRSDKRLDNLRLRAEVLHLIRDWFHVHDFVEVETPVRIAKPALELHIDAIVSKSAFLRTSPELHMKRLVACGMERIYQIGPCFRDGESGPLHNPEYCMLEWYRAGVDYRVILEDTISLIRHVCPSSSIIVHGQSVNLSEAWYEVSVCDAFHEHAGWDPRENFVADRFDIDLIEKVEPNLPRDRPVVLIDYPAQAAALSRLKIDDRNLAERWELYIGGIEVANAYSELTNPTEQRARFLACTAARKALGKPRYPIDEDFLGDLRYLPECGGIALGVDRLVMLLANATNLREVTAFQEALD